MQCKPIILCLLLSLSAWWRVEAAVNATVTHNGGGAQQMWLLENEAVKVEVTFDSAKGIYLSQLYGKDAGHEYLMPGDGSSLFYFKGHYLYHGFASLVSRPVLSSFEFDANDADWHLGVPSVEDIQMSTLMGKVSVGKRLFIPVHKDSVAVRLSFEIYDGKAGLRYQTFPRNLARQYKLMVEESRVIRLAFPNEPHNLHYVENTHWQSTESGINEAPLNNKGKGVAKVMINRYKTGYGWFLNTEVNWKTQYGPELPSSSYDYMLRSFAGCTAWAVGSERFVEVLTHPESLQLVLFPGEEFEYIPINLNLFKGDIVDGKMCAEEHLRKRFRYNNLRSLWNTNDWDWFVNGNRNEEFYKNIVIPQARAAGLDMLMFDDGWNNANASGTGLDNSGASRDKVEASPTITSDMEAFAEHIIDNGFKFGLWYSMSGGNHNKGFDLASPDVIEAKRQKVEYLINNYMMSHQMVDLTEFWQVTDESDYSHPSDNVYRKNVRTRTLMNELVDKYPQYVVKVTSELDIYPTQGDRCATLGHLTNNGWHTSVGDGTYGAGGMGCLAYSFGHYPLNSMYYGGSPNGSVESYYNLMAARNIKFGSQPDKWDAYGVQLMGVFNRWRKSARMTEMVENPIRPVYLGRNWDSSVAEEWDVSRGPFIWMYHDEPKNQALMIATNNGLTGEFENFRPSLRWLDPLKTYLVQDITLDDTGVFTYNYKGRYTGQELNSGSFEIDLYENSSRGKAYWIQASNGGSRQVLYADHFIHEYTELIDGKTLTVNVKGVPNAEGLVVVYDFSLNRIARLPVSIDSNGVGMIAVNQLPEQPDIPYPGFSGSVRYELENYAAEAELSNPAISTSTVYNGLGGADSGYSSFVGMTALGDYIIYNLAIPAAGTYELEVCYKLSKGSRGNAQWSIVDGDKVTLMGQSFTQATQGNEGEVMKKIKLGAYTFNSPGVKRFKLTLVAGVGTGKALSTDYVNLIHKQQPLSNASAN